MRGRRRRAARGAAVLLLAVACGPPSPRGAPPPVDRNLLANPGFERGRAGWSIVEASPHWGDFEIVERPVRSGARAVHLPVRTREGQDEARGVRVFGVVQELAPERFPDVLGGWYRVESWEKDDDATDLYLQVVLIAWRDDRRPPDPGSPLHDFPNIQIRYLLAGLDEPPFELANARMQLVTRAPPRPGVWTPFEVHAAADFERLWGAVPRAFRSLRVLFEGRWDNKPAGTGVRADVYFDDLYVGHRDATGGERGRAGAAAR